MNIVKCKICGKEEDVSHWTNEKEMVKHQMCFDCNFWHGKQELDAKRKEHTWAVIDGTHYYLESESPAFFRGFGGRKFHIRFNDGFETTCSNLWCQGDIPEGYWRERFPDNAVFVDGETWKESVDGTKYLLQK